MTTCRACWRTAVAGKLTAAHQQARNVLALISHISSPSFFLIFLISSVAYGTLSSHSLFTDILVPLAPVS